MATDVSDEATVQAHAAGFRMLEGETLAGLLERYQQHVGHADILREAVDGARTMG